MYNVHQIYLSINSAVIFFSTSTHSLKLSLLFVNISVL